MTQRPATLRFIDNRLSLLDQRRLPQQIEYLDIDSIETAYDAIQSLAVRGAPAIGVAAAYALAQSMLATTAPTATAFSEQLASNGARLKSARPTAVNLAWAIDRLINCDAHQPTDSVTQRANALVSEAKRIHREDVQICEGIGRHGAPLIQPGSRVLTHCNAGALAVTGIGTATAPLYARHSQGIQFKVFADETRPLYQGARLTAWELDQAGIDVTVLCDNTAASLMDRGNIDLVIVGTDRVTANGDVVNKIGTLNVAILCQHFGIPMYVACPSSTYDAQTPTGSDVKIEQRDEVEVLGDHAAHVRAVNPAFDVTPAHMITGIITEHGISTNPRALARTIKTASDLQ